MTTTGMSRRTPETPAFLNNADNIERYLQEDGHQTWGFVIYRCTYKSDVDWATFIARLRYRIQEALEMYNGLDMMDRLALTVIEDKLVLDDASTAVVREHFKQWTATALEQEQGAVTAEGVSPVPSLAQRYRYCILVDEGSLESVVEDAPAPPLNDATSDGFVVLVWKDWVPLHNPRDHVEEPLEGWTVHDVGWMMVAYQDVMVNMYYHLRDYDDWYTEYRRPPQVARA